MKYFEGEVIYCNQYWHRARKAYERFSYKNGNYLSDEITAKKNRKKHRDSVLFIHSANELYSIDHTSKMINQNAHLRDKSFFYYFGSLILSDEKTFYRTVFCEKVGTGNVLGYHCDILEIKVQIKREGDPKLEERHFRQWVTQSLRLNPEYKHRFGEYFYFADDSHYSPYCLTLKYEEINENEPMLKAEAIEVNPKFLEHELFTLEVLEDYDLEPLFEHKLLF